MSNETDIMLPILCALSVHTDDYIEGTVVYDPDIVHLTQGGLYILAPRSSGTSIQDFQKATSANLSTKENDTGRSSLRKRHGGSKRVSQIAAVESHADLSKSMVFVAQPLNAEQKRKLRGMQISVHSSAASIFGFRNNSQVVVIPADEQEYSASHVEIVFRDQYLARADMWRLTVSELSNRSICKGQRILFMGTIKATVKNIYSEGKKISSAYFSSDTKPIFRSESAKYVIFIQMSREMWDFDAEGSGEIMFNKVINGFLPDLFKRWQKMNVRHLVSIILFTRLEYEEGVLVQHENSGSYCDDEGGQNDNNRHNFRDYYRVVTTEAPSGKWVDILYRLRQEFLTFLRDVSIVGGSDAYGRPPETLAGVKTSANIESVIAGQPTTATKGNVLEAINLASSQFTKDYVDRDLVRTGLSLVIITAGTGVFEVDYNMLKLTTDSLVGSGIGVDLVSLARMPLHSVPLFRYRSPHRTHALSGLSNLSDSITFHPGSTPRQGLVFPEASGGSGTLLQGGRVSFRDSKQSPEQRFGTQIEYGVEWSYALPHWIDVSFWSGHSDEAQIRQQHGLAASRKNNQGKRKRPFTTSCRMYELQMMGLMENEMSDIAISLLPEQIHDKERHQLQAGGSSLTESKLSASYGSTRSFLDSQMQSPRGLEDNMHHVPTRKDLKELGDMMNMYDRDMFQEPESSLKSILDHADPGLGKVSGETMTRYSQSPTKTRISLLSGSSLPKSSLPKGSMRGSFNLGQPSSRGTEHSQELLDAATTHAKVTTRKRAPMPRQISLGPRGLGTAKSTASISVSVESAGNSIKSPVEQVLPSNAPPAKAPSKQPIQTTAPSKFSTLTQHLLNTLTRKPSQASLARSINSEHGSDRDEGESSSQAQRSTPITIKDTPGTEMADESHMITVREASAPKAEDIVLRDASAVGRQSVVRTDSVAARADQHKTLSPLSAMSPWLTMLNPSNPKKHNMNIASQFRRWQHVFPKAIPTSAIKWKSLCSPAALPLTNEYFPNAEQLRNDYHEYIYKIMPIDDDEMSEAPRTREALIRELIGCRLSHGFQIVVGPAADEFVGSNAASLVQVFDKNYMTDDGATVLMTIGNHLHQLLCTDDGEIEVRRYLRKPVAAVESVGAVDPSVTYTPYIRTFIAHEYELQPVIFKNPRPTYYWNAIDQHLAGYEEDYSPALRYWRARFVLIPVDPKIRSGQLGFVSENSDEEIRLEGIQKLTQLWQRHRYIPPEERRFQLSLQQRKKDPNPLAIEYQTRDLSQMARSHAAGLSDALLAGEPGHDLFAESEQYHTSDFDMQKLAQHLQSDPPRGVPLADRRWHFRTHHRCFRGDHLTSWLLSNFKDIHEREEAVRLGDALMKRGLFTHVMQKHQFRDGNYFYQIEGEYSTMPYTDNRQSWFSTGRSVPTTPMFEGPKGSPKLWPVNSPKLRPSDSPRLRPTGAPRTPMLQPADQQLRPRSATVTEESRRPNDENIPGKKAQLVLSRVLRYDVDHRKRSYRPEIINLHYDRIHNPENCYHIRIDWMNVTAKLIEDAINSWAASVERYGLRLVEVPIAEGFALLRHHPFRRPYIIRMSVPPPRNKPRYDTDSVKSQPIQEEAKETHPYLRALLQKFDFVLDMEAASSFDASLDVSYSWGKPDYRYTQFIHKSGVLLVQIDDNDNLLLCANRLCVDRASAVRESGKFDKSERPERPRGPVQPSPHASPIVRPTYDTPARNATPARHANKKRVEQAPDTLLYPEIIKDQLEELCLDPQKLQEFYDTAFAKESAETTPTPSPRQTPVLDAYIPSLGLPPAITLRNISFLETPRGGMPTSRRTSTQGFPKSAD
ncbi:hypothetical protein BDV97DRAFT_400269 [Delphinella strobiligena]|nr:hypothetical protein BDV97DRAFT_400269 [Delphinella strobiligena]